MSKKTIYAEDAIEAVHNLYAIFGSEGEWVDRKDVFEAIEQLRPAQPEPAIPLSWIEGQIEWLKSLDNAFSTLIQITTMVKKWKDEQAEHGVLWEVEHE